MIIAVDLLPRIEYLYRINELIPYEKMESEKMKAHVVSHAIHGARAIRVLQGDVIFTGILGGFVGKYAKHYMDIKKIKTDIVWAEKQTPHEIKIFDEKTNQETVIQKELKELDERILWKIEQRIRLAIKPNTTLLLEGRILNGLCPQTYSSLIKDAKRYSAKTVVTTNEPKVLSDVLEQVPYGLMFTIDQLGDLGINTDHVEGIVQQLRAYIEMGVHYIGIDLQNQGGLILSKSKFCYVEPTIDDGSLWTDKSGSAFLGAFTLGIDRKYEQERIAKLAVATALAFQKSKQNESYNKSVVDKLLKKVKVRELSKN